MICACGGECREHQVLAGWVVTCNACGRRELFERKRKSEEVGETCEATGEAMNLTNWHKQGQGLDHLGHAIDCRCAECVRWWQALFTPLAGGPLEPEAPLPTVPAGNRESASDKTPEDSQ